MTANIEYIEHLLYEINNHKKQLEFYNKTFKKASKLLSEEEKSKLRFIHGDDIFG